MYYLGRLFNIKTSSLKKVSSHFDEANGDIVIVLELRAKADQNTLKRSNTDFSLLRQLNQIAKKRN